MEGKQINQPYLISEEWVSHSGVLNFYRFCQVLEQAYSEGFSLGATESLLTEPVRFRHWQGLGFPASEMRYLASDNPTKTVPFVVRTTFLGLYGVDGVLPSSMVSDMAKNQEETQGFAALLDIFYHRLLTQYYRIWCKYRYPICFLTGARDKVSQCLLCLTGRTLVKPGVDNEIPRARWLALLGPMSQRTRTAEGIVAIVRHVLPNADVEVHEGHPICLRMPSVYLSRAWSGCKPQTVRLQQPVKARFSQANERESGPAWVPIISDGEGRVEGRRFKLGTESAVLGCFRLDRGLAIRVVIITDIQTLLELLPGERGRHDLLGLIQGYLGWCWDVYWFARVPSAVLRLCSLGKRCLRLGMTSYMASRTESETVELPVGRYCAQAPNPDSSVLYKYE